jgi:hypothetical protein
VGLECTFAAFAGIYVSIHKNLTNQGTGAFAEFLDDFMINIKKFLLSSENDL